MTKLVTVQCACH